MRREGDSNPRNPLEVYTLSRRASSATRASLRKTIAKIEIIFERTKFLVRKVRRSFGNVSYLRITMVSDDNIAALEMSRLGPSSVCLALNLAKALVSLLR